MATQDCIERVVYRAIDDVNRQLPPDAQLPKVRGTVLLGENGRLDSLGVVNLIVATEQRLEEETGLAVSLVTDQAFSEKTSPFNTVETLIGYISSVLGTK